MKCQNYWFRYLGKEFDAETDFDTLFERVDCPESATVVAIDFDGSHEVCESCLKVIELTNWLHTPEGQAALDESDWELDE